MPDIPADNRLTFCLGICWELLLESRRFLRTFCHIIVGEYAEELLLNVLRNASDIVLN